MKKALKTGLIDKLNERLREISHLGSILGLLDWDQSVYMPSKASDPRSLSVASLSSIVHNKFVTIDSDGLLSKLKKQLDGKKLKGKNAAIVLETWKSYDRARKLPDSFVREMAEVASKAQAFWVEARKKSDFQIFLPWLVKIIKLKRQEAEYIGYKKSPYDALLDGYEPGMTTEEVYRILNDLKDFLVPFIKSIKESKVNIDSDKIKGHFPIDQQIKFNEQVVTQLGFDFEAGRIDKTVHPFAASLHPHDVRITTRYSEEDLFHSLGSIIHEVGHGLYEQGLPHEHFGTPLAESISLGIHESQSRMMENMIGKSLSFWKHFYPKLQAEFPVPFKKLPLKDFYQSINKVNPSFIRTESDEVTYNLHIILRFELERELLEGSIDPKDLPELWNFKMKEYFGLKVPKDSLGVLQDTHWASGLIGYFPTYALGNLYAAQFYAAMRKEIPKLDQLMGRGQFKVIREWLLKNIHSRGKLYTAAGLVKKVTGEDLNSQYFIDYLTRKYQAIYNLK